MTEPDFVQLAADVWAYAQMKPTAAALGAIEERLRAAHAPQAAEPAFYVVQVPTGEYETWLYVRRASAERAAARRGEPGYVVQPLYLAPQAPAAQIAREKARRA